MIRREKSPAGDVNRSVFYVVFLTSFIFFFNLWDDFFGVNHALLFCEE